MQTDGGTSRKRTNMSSEITTPQKHLLAQLNSLVNKIDKADDLLKSGQPNLATTQLLSVIARTLVMQLAAGQGVAARFNLFHSDHQSSE